MSDFDNTNSGALHKNDRKTQDNHPNYKGDCLPVCHYCGNKTSFWLSAWIKTARSGKKWMSIAFQKKDDQLPALSFQKHADPKVNPQEPDSHSIDFDEDIPF